MSVERRSRDGEGMMVPRYGEEPWQVVVDSTWGTIQPLHLPGGVETVAELDVIEHMEAGLPLVDTRSEEHRRDARLPGSVGIPHDEITERMDELDRGVVTILYCNGPPCGATPNAVEALLEAGYPADRLRYYRGGIHDWMTLGLPVEGERAG